LIEVSSTFIRESLKQGKDVRYFLHPKVWERIVHTYCHSERSEDLLLDEVKNLDNIK
jgi:hypothetical protein